MSRQRSESPSESSRADALLEAYLRDIDRSLLRENLRRSPQERFENLIALQRFFEEARRAREQRLDVLVRGLEKLIEVKRAAGRPKDLEAIAELIALLEERDRRP